MDTTELVDRSAQTALAHASALQDLLRVADRSRNPVVGECRADLHRLVGDIVSLRNAAELLKRESGQDA